MARIELVRLRKALGRGDRGRAASTSRSSDGEFVALLGPSGCGKSTTLFLLAGIYAPSGGEIRFDGRVVNEVEARDRNVGIVFQSYALYPHMTVRAQHHVPAAVQEGRPRPRRERRAEEAARLVHVYELLERLPAEMSGGQQQRVALARALVKEPQLLLLDEPLSNLDATLRLTMRGEIKRLQRQLGVTTILVTHDQLEATTMADRIICMRQGRIEQAGTADDLYLRPNSLFVAGFIGSPPINLLPGTAERGALQVERTTLAYAGAAEGPVVLGIRPEAVRFEGHGIQGRIGDIEPMGRETLYLVESELGLLRVLEAGSTVRHRPGDQVALGFDPAAALIFDRASERLIPDAHLARAA